MKRDDMVPFGVVTGKLDGGLDGFRAGIGEENFFGAAAGSESVEVPPPQVERIVPPRTTT